MPKLLFLLFILTHPILLLGQDCVKAWMHYEERVALAAETEKKFGLKIPIDKIQFDFLGAPIGVPYNYSLYEYAPYSDNVTLDNNLLLHKEAAKQLAFLRSAALAAKIELKINNTYRSYHEQTKLFKKLGAHQAERPGYSEHHLYTALDFENITSKKLLWLLQNAFDFGWVPSYYLRMETNVKQEPWHWRYVGELAASKFRCAWEEEIKKTIWRLKKR